MRQAEVQCGFLTYHPRHPDMPNVVRYENQWMPESLATGMNYKRFTDAELAAEFEASRCDAMVAKAAHAPTYWAPLGETWENTYDAATERTMTLLRFALNPHFDEPPETTRKTT